MTEPYIFHAISYNIMFLFGGTSFLVPESRADFLLALAGLSEDNPATKFRSGSRNWSDMLNTEADGTLAAQMGLGHLCSPRQGHMPLP